MDILLYVYDGVWLSVYTVWNAVKTVCVCVLVCW